MLFETELTIHRKESERFLRKKEFVNEQIKMKLEKK